MTRLAYSVGSLCVSELALMLMLHVHLATILRVIRHFHSDLSIFSRIAPLNKRDFCEWLQLNLMTKYIRNTTITNHLMCVLSARSLVRCGHSFSFQRRVNKFAVFFPALELFFFLFFRLTIKINLGLALYSTVLCFRAKSLREATKLQFQKKNQNRRQLSKMCVANFTHLQHKQYYKP